MLKRGANKIVGEFKMTQRKALVPTLGQWVDGDRFWGREHEIARFIEFLDEGASISLLAPRRTGKTSLMREVARVVSDRYTCFHLDLESSRTPADVLSEIVRASAPHATARDRILKTCKSILGSTREIKLATIELKLREGLPGRWEDRGTRLLTELTKLEPTPILFIDEVPVFVHRLLCESGEKTQPTQAGLHLAESFLSWLRHTVQAHRGCLRIVITGSIGMRPLLERHGLTSLIDCYAQIELLPWDRETVRGCLRSLALHRGISFESGAENNVVDLLGVASPYYTQLFFDSLLEHAQRHNHRSIFPEDVEVVYHQKMLGPSRRSALCHYASRLRQAFAPVCERFAMVLLAKAASDGGLTYHDALALADEHCRELSMSDRSLVIRVLEHDGYFANIDQNSGICRFASNYLRDWWTQRFITPKR